MEVIFEDDDIVVINKDAGIASHASTSWKGDDVYSWLKRRGVSISTSGDEYRQGIVSRLDVGTSGVMVIAKNEDAYVNLKEQFANHSVTKIYTALAHGTFKVTHGTIDAPIGRHPGKRASKRASKHAGKRASKRAIFAVVDDGKPAVTHFDITVSGTFEGMPVSKASIRLETGRTHQIRVHFAAYQHPLFGDPLYLPPNQLSQDQQFLSRPFLHSNSLEFIHPTTAQTVSFNSELPPELNNLLISANL